MRAERLTSLLLRYYRFIRIPLFNLALINTSVSPLAGKICTLEQISPNIFLSNTTAQHNDFNRTYRMKSEQIFKEERYYLNKLWEEMGGKCAERQEAKCSPNPRFRFVKSKKVASRSSVAEKLETLETDHPTVKRITGPRYPWTTRFHPDEKFLNPTLSTDRNF